MPCHLFSLDHGPGERSGPWSDKEDPQEDGASQIGEVAVHLRHCSLVHSKSMECPACALTD